MFRSFHQDQSGSFGRVAKQVTACEEIFLNDVWCPASGSAGLWVSNKAH